MNIKQKIGAGLATALMLGGMFAVSAHAATIKISGNGEGSHNTVNATHVNVSKVKQKTTTLAFTWVSSSANTGGNTANSNTGGSVSNTSGSADSTVTTTVTGGSNVATVTPCGCVPDDSSVTISRNGEDSHNTVNVTDVNVSKTSQSSTTVAITGVSSSADTGGNTANGNTGGSVTQTSGDASSTVTTTVSGGSNVLNP